MIAAVYCYFSLFHSLYLLLLSVLFSVCQFFFFFCIFLRSKIFTTVLLIIGRQLTLCFSGGLTLHDICLQFDSKIWQINYWWWWWWSLVISRYQKYRDLHRGNMVPRMYRELLVPQNREYRPSLQPCLTDRASSTHSNWLQFWKQEDSLYFPTRWHRTQNYESTRK